MTQEAALHQFWNSFDIPAYNSVNVPDDATYPYIVYDMASGLWDDLAFPNISIWYRGNALTLLHNKVREIAETLKDGGTRIQCDGGMMWITAGTPWCNYMTDPEDDQIKRAVLNVNINFVTI